LGPGKTASIAFQKPNPAVADREVRRNLEPTLLDVEEELTPALRTLAYSGHKPTSTNVAVLELGEPEKRRLSNFEIVSDIKDGASVIQVLMEQARILVQVYERKTSGVSKQTSKKFSPEVRSRIMSGKSDQ
jgi:hypothetical protein